MDDYTIGVLTNIGLIAFLAFVGIVLVAYVYIWRKGALEWH